MVFQKGNTYSKGRVPWNKGVPRTDKDKETISKSLVGKHNSPSTEFKRGLIPWDMGIKRPEMCGDKNPMKIPEVVKKVVEKISGEKNHNWKGGSKLSGARKAAKRKGRGFFPLNEPFENSHGHHLNDKYVLYIPEELHKSIWHDQWNGYNMDEINQVAIDWYFNKGGI